MAGMFYSLEEAVEKLNATEEQVKELVKKGKLREFRDGSNVLFKVEEVEALMSDTGVTASEETPAAVEEETDEDKISLVSEAAAPEIAMPDTTVPEPAAPEAAAPETAVPEPAVPETPVPEPAAPETPVLEPAVPETPVPEPAVPEIAVPEPAVPETPVPEPAVPEIPVLEPTVPEIAVPEPAVPEIPVPEAMAPETPVLEPTAPEIAVPEPAVPEIPVPEAMAPETTEDTATGDELTDADTVVADEGVNVLGETDGQKQATDDTTAETEGVTAEASLEEIEEDVNLDTFGSGSGLLDLSLQADDTSLGGILDEIYTSEGEEGQETRESSALEVPVEAEQMLPEDELAGPQPTPEVPAVVQGYIEPEPDTISNAFGIVLFLPLLVIVYTAIVATAGFNNVMPVVREKAQDIIWYIMIGLAVAAGLIIGAAFMLTSGTGEAGKKKKARKPKRAKKKPQPTPES